MADSFKAFLSLLNLDEQAFASLPLSSRLEIVTARAKSDSAQSPEVQSQNQEASLIAVDSHINQEASPLQSSPNKTLMTPAVEASPLQSSPNKSNPNPSRRIQEAISKTLMTPAVEASPLQSSPNKSNPNPSRRIQEAISKTLMTPAVDSTNPEEMPFYLEAIASVRTLKYTRQRMKFPTAKVVLNADFFSVMPPEGLLWLKRLAAVIAYEPAQSIAVYDVLPTLDFETTDTADDSDYIPALESESSGDESASGSDKEDDEMKSYAPSKRELLCEIITARHVFEFETYLATHPTPLTSATLRKGFFSLGTAIQRITGKNLSKVDPELRPFARETLDAISDLARDYQQQATLDANVLECKRLTHFVQNQNPTDMMKALYVIFAIQLLKAQEVISSELGFASCTAQLEWFAGLIIFGVLLARPCSRPQTFSQMKKKQIAEASEGKSILLLFPMHKTGKSYHTLVAEMPPFAAEMLLFYVKNILPVLQTQWLFSDVDSVFPDRWPKLLNKFLMRTGLSSQANLTPGRIRSLFCQAIGAIPQTSRYFADANDLQKCAAHQSVNTHVIETFYDSSAKLKREKKLQAFVHEEFLMPALQTASGYGKFCFPSAFLVLHQQTSPTVTPKRKTMEAPTARTCRNRRFGKRCLTPRGSEVVFSSNTLNCDLCVAGLLGLLGLLGL